jgi:hypothetical protein
MSDDTQTQTDDHVAAPLGDPDAQDVAVEQHTSEHLRGQVENLEQGVGGEPRALAAIAAEIRGCANALEAVAQRRLARAEGHS